MHGTIRQEKCLVYTWISRTNIVRSVKFSRPLFCQMYLLLNNTGSHVAVLHANNICHLHHTQHHMQWDPFVEFIKHHKLKTKQNKYGLSRIIIKTNLNQTKQKLVWFTFIQHTTALSSLMFFLTKCLYALKRRREDWTKTAHSDCCLQ